MQQQVPAGGMQGSHWDVLEEVVGTYVSVARCVLHGASRVLPVHLACAAFEHKPGAFMHLYCGYGVRQSLYGMFACMHSMQCLHACIVWNVCRQARTSVLI
jgi:hypothetical protein